MIVGTAGHVDHGKTSLVRALTGIDTDRLPEEKRRGMTLELGFAHLALPDGPVVGVVDVPGHERFVKAMAAGAGGIDVAMLVVAADEGVKPQTREHIDVCTLLGVKAGLLVVSKVDLAPQLPADWQATLESQLRAVTNGTCFDSAPFAYVSAHSGAGLEALKRALATLVASAPTRPAEGPLCMPIDRAFSLKGFGCVVTGTVLSGTLKGEDVVALRPDDPGGLRVRGLHQFGAAVDTVRAGQRAAVNLAGLEVAAVSRGMVLTRATELTAVNLADVEVTALASAPGPLPRRSRHQVTVGTAHVSAALRLLDADQLAPGASGFGQLRFASPVCVIPGQRFILRRASAGTWATVAGGRVLSLAPPRRRHGGGAALAELASPVLATRVERLVRDAGHRGLTDEQVFVRSVADPTHLSATVSELLEQGRVLAVESHPRRVVHRSAIDLAARRLVAKVSASAEPVPRATLQSALGLDAEVLHAVLSRAEGAGSVVVRGEQISRPGAAPNDSPQALSLLQQLQRAGLAPPAVSLLAARVPMTEAAAVTVLRTLARSGRVVGLGELWFDAHAVKQLEAALVSFLRAHGRISTAEFKTLVGQSRKFAIPLAEYFDAQRITLRVGELRTLRTP